MLNFLKLKFKVKYLEPYLAYTDIFCLIECLYKDDHKKILVF